jgi:hypothetical protein
MGIKNWFSPKVTEDQKDDIRKIARLSWIEADGDMTKAKAICRQKVKEKYGSIVVMITVAAALLQIAYTLFKFWQDLNQKRPAKNWQLAERRFVFRRDK